MKSYIIIVMFLGMTITSFSQNNTERSNDEGTMRSIKLPEIVIKNAGKDFSVYLTDKTHDLSVKKLENDFIAYNIGKDYEGYDNYLVILEGEKGVLTATYNAKGKLTSVVEKYSNIQLPPPVIYSVYNKYPGWLIVNDKYLFTQENGKISKKEYNLKLKKENEIIKLKMNPEGDIINKS